MPFVPKISVCFRNKCTQLIVTDTTGVYHAKNNPNGWEHASTLLADKVSSMTISIKHPSGVIVTNSVISNLPNPVTGPIEFNQVPGNYEDGVYTITYTVVDALNNVYTKTVKAFAFCKIECCVQKMIAKITSKCSCDLKEYTNEVYTAMVLLEGLKANAVCGNETKINKILTKLQRICNNNKCNCN
jgi:hypothetical protein